jgi:hypothetical protein
MSIDDRMRAGLAANAELLPPPVEEHLDAVRRRHRHRTRGRVLLAVAASVVLAVAAPLTVRSIVGTGPEPAEPAPSPSLTGSYRVVVRGAGATADMTGSWTVTLGADGQVQLKAPADASLVADEGLHYQVRGDVLTTNLFLDRVGCQRGDPPVGAYEFAVSGTRASFTTLSDVCEPRVLLFSSTWERLP